MQEAHNRRRQAGMTLVEVLIAAAILGVGLTALLTAASRCLAVMRTAKQYQTAQWALNLGELEHPVLPAEDPKDWEVSPQQYDGGMTYSREVQEPEEDQEDGLYLLTSHVTWSTRGHQGSEDVMRYVFVKEKAEL